MLLCCNLHVVIVFEMRLVFMLCFDDELNMHDMMFDKCLIQCLSELKVKVCCLDSV